MIDSLIHVAQGIVSVAVENKTLAFATVGLAALAFAASRANIDVSNVTHGVETVVNVFKGVKSSMTGLDLMRDQMLDSFNQIPLVMRTKNVIVGKTLEVATNEASLVFGATMSLVGKDGDKVKDSIKANMRDIRAKTESSIEAVTQIPQKGISSVQARINAMRTKSEPVLDVGMKLKT
jgi:hypothetical protein